MPITKSAEKALRQSERRRIKNLQKKNSYKSSLKSLSRLVKEGKTEEAGKFLSKTFKAIDKAAKTNVINKNKAARLKSKASKMLAKK
jgi:small subunit ribosomal protein S20